MRKNLPPKSWFLNRSIERYPNYRIAQWINTGSNGHLFRAHNDKISRDLAFKVIPLENIPTNDGGATRNLDEVRKANVLQHRSVVKVTDVVELIDQEEICDCIILVCDYIEGSDLKHYVEKNKNNLGVPFIESYLTTMLELLYELQQRELWHGDLHAGNVIIGNSEYDIYNRPSFWITDFGSRPQTSDTGIQSDFSQIATIDLYRRKCSPLARA